MNAFWKSKGLNELTWGQDIIEAAFKGEKVNGKDLNVLISGVSITGGTANTITFNAMVYLMAPKSSTTAV
jgi:hypothetical protein